MIIGSFAVSKRSDPDCTLAFSNPDATQILLFPVSTSVAKENGRSTFAICPSSNFPPVGLLCWQFHRFFGENLGLLSSAGFWLTLVDLLRLILWCCLKPSNRELERQIDDSDLFRTYSKPVALKGALKRKSNFPAHFFEFRTFLNTQT